MMVVTLERAKLHLEAWLDAELAVSQGQAYTIGSRSLTRANIAEIRKQIGFWEKKVDELEIAEKGGRVRRAKRFIPRDL
ncbi:Uncharacterised protein [Lysinibacillus capsici]|uniref:Uncharacterized protein n=1 Tax=Lysinibacillus capsici TaxID=2115968 RepID=A0A2X0XZ19_9BACI|nr:DUF6148 family protein [Lysinibacillus capsici]SPT95570.1 Uncharacterised protein [Lysinibacillus capsici]